LLNASVINKVAVERHLDLLRVPSSGDPTTFFNSFAALLWFLLVCTDDFAASNSIVHCYADLVCRAFVGDDFKDPKRSVEL
jgi:hypothetical protein